MVFVIGLTGGIGSGKTAVSDRFQDLGINIVDADVVARIVVEPGRPALTEISKRFGQDILLADGNLDRRRLRDIVFKNPEERSWLESVTHPKIGEEIFAQLNNTSSPYAILASPLLIETAQKDLTQRILVVDVPVELQLQRTMQRDNADEQQVRAIIKSQASREQRCNAADDIIVNDQDLAHLDREVSRLHQDYLQLASSINKS